METAEYSVYNKKNLSRYFDIASFYSLNYQNYTMKLHSHKRIEIMYVNFGEMEVEYLDGGTPRKMILKTGEYVFIDAFCPHRITIYDTPTQTLNLEMTVCAPESADAEKQYPRIYDVLVREPVFREFLANKLPIFKLYDDGTVLSTVITIQGYLKKDPRLFADTFINLNVGMLLLSVARMQNEQYVNKIGIFYLKKAVSYINENYTAAVTSREIAEVSGISQCYLNKLFLQTFSLTINGYLNRFRVDRAKKLIEQTELPLSQIHKIVGFPSKQNFNKQFIRYNKTTPSQYREDVYSQNIRIMQSDGKDNIHYPDSVYHFVYDSRLNLDE